MFVLENIELGGGDCGAGVTFWWWWWYVQVDEGSHIVLLKHIPVWLQIISYLRFCEIILVFQTTCKPQSVVFCC